MLLQTYVFKARHSVWKSLKMYQFYTLQSYLVRFREYLIMYWWFDYSTRLIDQILIRSSCTYHNWIRNDVRLRNTILVGYIPSSPIISWKYIDGQYIMQMKSFNKKPMEHGRPRVFQQHVEALTKVGLMWSSKAIFESLIKNSFQV